MRRPAAGRSQELTAFDSLRLSFGGPATGETALPSLANLQLPGELVDAVAALNPADATGSSAAALERLARPIIDSLAAELWACPERMWEPNHRDFARTWTAACTVVGIGGPAQDFSRKIVETVGRLLAAGDYERQLAGATLAGFLGAAGEGLVGVLTRLTRSKRETVRTAAKIARRAIRKALRSSASTLRETPDPTPRPDREPYGDADDAINDVRAMARQKLDFLLATLVGRKFVEQDTVKAREAVRVVNHLASILNVQLYYSSQPVSLKCVFGDKRSPTFQVRSTGSSQATVKSGQEFPALQAR